MMLIILVFYPCHIHPLNTLIMRYQKRIVKTTITPPLSLRHYCLRSNDVEKVGARFIAKSLPCFI